MLIYHFYFNPNRVLTGSKQDSVIKRSRSRSAFSSLRDLPSHNTQICRACAINNTYSMPGRGTTAHIHPCLRVCTYGHVTCCQTTCQQPLRQTPLRWLPWSVVQLSELVVRPCRSLMTLFELKPLQYVCCHGSTMMVHCSMLRKTQTSKTPLVQCALHIVPMVVSRNKY